MSDLLTEFEAACKLAKIEPTAALRAGGVHPTLWAKWRDGRASPTLRNFERARNGLQALAADAADDQAVA